MPPIPLERARRIALAAQGFADGRASGRVDVRHYRRVLRRTKLLQLDSVNVLARAHYLPVFSRVGPYPMHALDDFAYERAELFEYWGHAASLLPVEHYPLFGHRMDDQTPGRRVRRLMEEDPGYLDAVLDEVARRGPVTISTLENPGERTGPWWGRPKGKTALEWHFACGRLAATREPTFTRVYDLPERVLPADALDAAAPEREAAHRALLLLAAEAHGIGTARDLADYYRLSIRASRARLAELVDEGALELVEVEGWDRTAYRHPEAHTPRRVRARALLCPFDPLVWERDRVERLFDFHYRIEIYVPADDRQYGYYVLPFLLDEALVARVDLKADRDAGLLRVRGAYLEPGADEARVAAELRDELALMAEWLSLDAVAVEDRGDLAPALRRVAG